MKKIEDLPLVLNAEIIADILGCSKLSVYELMKQKDFLVVKIGRLKIVSREAFFRWMEQQAEPKAQ